MQHSWVCICTQSTAPVRWTLCHLWPDNGLPNSCSQYKETLAVTLFLNKHRPSGRRRSIKMLTGPEKQYFSSWFVWRLGGGSENGANKFVDFPNTHYLQTLDFGGLTESTKAKIRLLASGVLAPHTHVPKQSLPVEERPCFANFLF